MSTYREIHVLGGFENDAYCGLGVALHLGIVKNRPIFRYCGGSHNRKKTIGSAQNMAVVNFFGVFEEQNMQCPWSFHLSPALR